MDIRPIDANALEKAIQELKKSPWYNGENGNYERIIRAEAIGIVTDLCVKQTPTLDYAPVRHGEWLWDGNHGTYCSCCKKLIPSVCYYSWDCDLAKEEIDETPFCPNCGAQMNVKEDAHG